MSACLTCQVLALADDASKDTLIRWQERQIERLLKMLAEGDGCSRTSTPPKAGPPSAATPATAP